jgi:hypothetical protein
MRLKGAMIIVKFYDDVGHPLDPDNMAWPVIKRFLDERRLKLGRHPRSRRIKQSTSGLMHSPLIYPKRLGYVMPLLHMLYGRLLL